MHADKHESLLQIDTMILEGMVKHSQNSQNSKSAMSSQYLKKEVRDEVDFLHVNKHQSFLQDEDSRKLYPSMVAHQQMTLEYLIIMHQIMHSFEIDISWLLNLLKLLILLK